MGFSGSHIVESMGQAGGIWCLWDVQSWKVSILNSSPQWVHLSVSWKRQESWLITVVYASPNLARRAQLWDDLSQLAETIDQPWSVLGDFNAILTDEERRGGASSPSTRGRQGFRDMISDCNLVDAGFQGSPFTWRNGSLFQRLDRILINMQWRTRFPQAAIFHLPYFKSDHRAVLMRMCFQKRPNRNRRPFRFLAVWLTHNDFPSLVARNWDSNACWGSHILKLQGALRKWNKEVFGNIFVKKKNLIEQLEHLDNQIASNPSSNLDNIRKEMWSEYVAVLVQEEILWYRKSRSKWLYFGDRNTRFFHGVTTIKRRKNTYDILQDRDGNWVGEPQQLENMVSSFYKDLFKDDGGCIPSPISRAFPNLSKENKRSLSKEVTRSDIFNVIKHMHPFKAPGIDGL